LSYNRGGGCDYSTRSLVLTDRDPWRCAIEAAAALDALFSEYAQAICAYLSRMLGDNGQAQELTQETFLRAYRALLRGESWANPRAWLYRTASRLAIDAYRRQRLLHWLPLSSPPAAPESETGALEQVAMRTALAALPLRYRVPLVLYTCEGYNVAEIADLLDISTSACKMRLCRAREMLRHAYGSEDER
jgi:RNA polymerase sigma-70 factor (ECF subfamily)